MSIATLRISNLEGELVDGPSHVEMSVELEVERVGDQVAITQTAKHPAAPDRAIRSEFGPEAATELRRALEQAADDDGQA